MKGREQMAAQLQREHNVEQTQQQSSIGINTRIILQITKGTSVPRGTLCAWIIAIYNPCRCDHVSSDLLLIEIINEIFTTSNAIVHKIQFFMLRTSPLCSTDRRSKGNAGGWGNYRPGGGEGNNYLALLHTARELGRQTRSTQYSWMRFRHQHFPSPAAAQVIITQPGRCTGSTSGHQLPHSSESPGASMEASQSQPSSLEHVGKQQQQKIILWVSIGEKLSVRSYFCFK